MAKYAMMHHALTETSSGIKEWTFKWAMAVDIDQEEAEKQNANFERTGVKYKPAGVEEESAKNITEPIEETASKLSFLGKVKSLLKLP